MNVEADKRWKIMKIQAKAHKKEEEKMIKWMKDDNAGPCGTILLIYCAEYCVDMLSILTDRLIPFIKALGRG
jgi:cobalamin synthase